MAHNVDTDSSSRLVTPRESWPQPYVIAIDGPAGAGKSSVSARVASELGFLRLDTGVIYRGVALAASRSSSHSSSHSSSQLLSGSELQQLLESFTVRLEGEQLKLNDVYADDPILRTPEVSQAASAYAALPEVRARLLEVQRTLALSAPCIVDGRDIGTVVFPNAPLKLFLTASVDERARRRHLELQSRGEEQALERVRSEMIERDRQDSEREIAPLKRAEDAHTVDATELTLDEVIARCVGLARAVFS